MPKFVVRRGHDAWIYYETIVEADTEAEARALADCWNYDGEWVETGETAEFDHSEIAEDGARLLEEGETIEPRGSYALTQTQRDMILAALRLWQDVVNDGGGGYLNESLIDIATNGDSHELLDDRAIDDLCEAINV